MFKRETPIETSELEKTIDSVHAEMTSLNADAPEYSKMVDQLSKLYAIKKEQAPRRVSPDTLALIAGNLAGIAMITWFEREHVMTSKALSFITKLK